MILFGLCHCPQGFYQGEIKVVFGLTKRQLICFGGALLVGVPLFLLIRGRIPTSAAALLMVFAMLPGFLLALYERHGQPLEVVVWQIIQCCFFSAQGTALPDQQRLHRPCAAIPDGTGGKCHCSKSKKTKRAQKRRSSSPAPNQKEIQAVIRRYKATESPLRPGEHPYEPMYPDGVCRLTPAPFPSASSFRHQLSACPGGHQDGYL